MRRFVASIALTIWTSMIFSSTADAEVIPVAGVTVECPNCAIVDTDTCQIQARGELVAVACSRALPMLLEDSAYRGAPNVFHEAELLSFLLASKQSFPVLKAGLEVLSRSDTGVSLISRHARKLLREYHDSLLDMLVEGTGSSRLWGLLWLHANSQSDPEMYPLVALIAHKNQGIDIEALLRTLTVINVQEDRKRLAAYSVVLENVNLEWSYVFQELLQRLEICSQLDSLGRLPSECVHDYLATADSLEDRYLQRAQMQLVMSHIQKHKPPSAFQLELLSQTNYVEFRTPTTHALLLGALRELRSAEKFNLSPTVLDKPGVPEMLTTFAENDDEVKRELALLYVWLGKRLADEGNRGAATNYLKRSVRIFTGAVDGRQALFTALLSDTRNPTERQRLNTLASESSSGSSPRSPSTSWFLLGVGICSLACFGGLLLRRTQLRSHTANRLKRQNALTRKERLELRRIQSFFQIPMWATENDLKRRYRVRVKELHPDTGQGSVEEFAKLHDRFKRGQELMARG